MNYQAYIFTLALLIPALTLATPDIQETQNTYNITGKNLAELQTALDQSGPEDHGLRSHARTLWHIRWAFSYIEQAQQCQITNASVQETITTTLPEWVNSQQADAGTQSQWSTYLQRLKTHEAGHSENARSAASEVEQAINSMPTLENCQELKTKTNANAQAIIDKYTQKDAAYDAMTQHGITQGAAIS